MYKTYKLAVQQYITSIIKENAQPQKAIGTADEGLRLHQKHDQIVSCRQIERERGRRGGGSLVKTSVKKQSFRVNVWNAGITGVVWKEILEGAEIK